MSWVAYKGTGFLRFLDQLTLHGLERFGLFYSEYRAEVVDNVDPLGQGKLKIRCPAVGDTSNTPPRTAYPNVPFAGKGFGLRNLPPVGSFTYVTFENGRLDVPLWRGGWWRKGEITDPELLPSDVYWWVTPSGHQVFLRDTPGLETVRIKHKLGAVLEIDQLGNIELSNFEPVTGIETTKVNLGSGANESAIKGDTLVSLLGELITAITTMTVGTIGGPSTVPLNVAVFKAIQARLVTALSRTVVVK